MTDKIQRQTPATQVQDLSPDQLEQVAGGHTGGVNVAMGDGSVRFAGDANGDGDVDGRDFLVWRKTSGVG